MKIGIFSDTHDHVDHVRQAVGIFNDAACDLVVFAGDFVSPIVVPPLRKLNCPMLACFGDNEGNKPGILAGMSIVGTVAEPPFGFETEDGCKILVTHILDVLKGYIEGSDVIIFAHTHRTSTRKNDSGQLFINPGEASGWTYRKPAVMFLETETLDTEVVNLSPMPAIN